MECDTEEEVSKLRKLVKIKKEERFEYPNMGNTSVIILYGEIKTPVDQKALAELNN